MINVSWDWTASLPPRAPFDVARAILAQDIELSGATAADQDLVAAARQDVPLLLKEFARSEHCLCKSGEKPRPQEQ